MDHHESIQFFGSAARGIEQQRNPHLAPFKATADLIAQSTLGDVSWRVYAVRASVRWGRPTSRMCEQEPRSIRVSLGPALIWGVEVLTPAGWSELAEGEDSTVWGLALETGLQILYSVPFLYCAPASPSPDGAP